MHNTNLIRSIEGTILSKYALGTEALGLSNDYDSELSSVPNSRLALLKEAY